MAVPFNEAKALLKSMFPAMDEATIGEMLRDNGGHMERTCEQLLAFFETDGCSGGGTGDSDGVRDRAHQGGSQGGGMAQGEGKEGGSSPHIRFGPPQIQEFVRERVEVGGTGATFPPPPDDFLTLDRYMSGRAGGGSGEGGGEGQMSADEALAWQLQDKLFLQVSSHELKRKMSHMSEATKLRMAQLYKNVVGGASEDGQRRFRSDHFSASTGRDDGSAAVRASAAGGGAGGSYQMRPLSSTIISAPSDKKDD